MENDIINVVYYNIKWEKDNYQYNKEQFRYLKKCADPVLKEWEESLILPNVNIDRLRENTIVKRVELDIRAEALIKAYLEKASEFFQII